MAMAAAAAARALLRASLLGGFLSGRSQALHVGGASEAAASCSCLNWHDAYKLHGVSCGQGLERYSNGLIKPENLTIVALPAADPRVASFRNTESGFEVCNLYYMRMNHSYALHPASWNFYWDEVPKAWCYVPGSCTELHGGAAVPGTGVSVKYNAVGEDQAIRDLSMEEILGIAARDIIDLGVFIGNSCYIAAGAEWDPESLSRDRLEQTILSKRPTLLMSDNHSKPRLFVHGEKVVMFQPGWPGGSRPFKQNF